jgi:four helix bundle protein
MLVDRLLVFKKSYQLSLEIQKINFPNDCDFVMQIRRSSKSICSNLTEGFAKQGQSKIEFKRYVFISVGSCEETRLWIRYAFDLGWIDKDTFDHLFSSYEEVSRMLYSLTKKLM